MKTTEQNQNEKWKPDPVQGGEHIEARRAETVAHLEKAAGVAYYHIEQQLELDIAELRKKAGEQKAKMIAVVNNARVKPAMTIVRKYWLQSEADVLHHLVETIMRD